MAAEPAPAATSNLPELSVSDLSQMVKRTMETAFDRVRVRGELGRVTLARSGHFYADLKDENAVLNMVRWKGQFAQLAFKPEEGLEVVAEGRLTTFAGKSSYQLIADRLEPAGVGALLAQLERLKAKLAAEGLFAQARKKPIPFLPEVIGVITSPTGAVIRDILHRLEERFPRRVLLWPVLVQGEKAAGQIAAAIEGFNRLAPGGAIPRPDVLIVARGGGSIEDLWAFNEEIVVRAAAASAIPLISAVGHETDTTLIDYASDLRAPTPTGAAEKAVPVRAELIARTQTLAGRLKGGLARGLELRRTELRAAAGRLPRAETLLETAQQRFDRTAERLGLALGANLRAHRAVLDRATAALRPAALARDIGQRKDRLTRLDQRLAPALARMIAERRRSLQVAERLGPALARAVMQRTTALAGAGRLLDTLSHRSVLARGFALVTRPDGALVRTAGALADGDLVEIAFADGAVPAAIGASPPAGGARRRGKREGEDQGKLF